MQNLTDDQIIAKALEILERRMLTTEHLTSPQATTSFLKLKLAGRDREAFCAVYLTAQHQVIAFEELSHGTLDAASVYPRVVIKAVLDQAAAAVIFAHNHPSGVAEPSIADRRITERLVEALALIEVRVLDHIIIGGANSYSFAEQGLL
ncbi:MAG: DNA repair protein RadC [Cyanobacteria bacterium P01_F01_bin.3]